MDGMMSIRHNNGADMPLPRLCQQLLAFGHFPEDIDAEARVKLRGLPRKSGVHDANSHAFYVFGVNSLMLPDLSFGAR